MASGSGGRGKHAQVWHCSLLGALSARLPADPDVLAVIAGGSLAGEADIDVWSDIDVMIVVTDAVLVRYYPSTGWLAPFGTILGAERHDGPLTKTLRVSLVGPASEDTGIGGKAAAPAASLAPPAAVGINRRLDLIIVPSTSLDEPALREGGFLQGDYTVLWSRLPKGSLAWGPDRLVADARSDASKAPDARRAEGRHDDALGPHEPALAPPDDLAERIDAFWFKATVAIGKVMRQDLLIAGHLALGLARDCLVLQMMRRDRALGTTVHRTGGWGNAVVGELWPGGGGASPVAGDADAILDLVARCATVFDRLATALSPTASPRAPLLQPSIAAARAALGEGRN